MIPIEVEIVVMAIISGTNIDQIDLKVINKKINAIKMATKPASCPYCGLSHAQLRAHATGSGLRASAIPSGPARPAMSVPWAEFLLLPGDGLLLLNEAGRLEWIDPLARQWLEPLLPALENVGLAVAWPSLQERITALEPQLERAPQDLELPLPQGGDPLPLRLFQTDTGLGVGLLRSGLDRELVGEPSLAALLGSMLNTIQDSLLITLAEPLDAPGPLIVYANDAVLQQTGFSRQEVLGRSPRLFQGPDTDRHVTRRFGEALRRWERAHMEVLNYSSSGRPYWIELKVAPLADADGWFTHWVSVQRDVSERREGEQALVAQALSDPLTGLPNRVRFMDELTAAIARSEQDGFHVALMFLDLDRFKMVNDGLGHDAGDRLLQAVARRLRGALRADDVLARFGGDEFTVILEDVESTGDIVSVDPEGFVSIRGRMKRFAKISGEMVSLTAVEDALAGAFPQYGLRCQTAVVTRPDADKGEALICCTNDAKLTLTEIRDAIKAKGLGNLCVPREIAVVKEIPKLGTGKVNHRVYLLPL